MSRNYLCFKVDLSFERTQTGRPSRDRALFNSLNWLFSFFSFFFSENSFVLCFNCNLMRALQNLSNTFLIYS